MTQPLKRENYVATHLDDRTLKEVDRRAIKEDAPRSSVLYTLITKALFGKTPEFAARVRRKPDAKKPVGRKPNPDKAKKVAKKAASPKQKAKVAKKKPAKKAKAVKKTEPAEVKIAPDFMN